MHPLFSICWVITISYFFVTNHTISSIIDHSINNICRLAIDVLLIFHNDDVLMRFWMYCLVLLDGIDYGIKFLF